VITKLNWKYQKIVLFHSYLIQNLTLTNQKNNSENCCLTLSTKINSEKLTEGDNGEINVEFKNISREHTGMAIAIIGLPGGCEPIYEQLKELNKKGIFDFYEIIGNNIVIYKKSLEENQSLKFNIEFNARNPGKYHGEASRCYLYYTGEQKYWVDGLFVDILPLK